MDSLFFAVVVKSLQFFVLSKLCVQIFRAEMSTLNSSISEVFNSQETTRLVSLRPYPKPPEVGQAIEFCYNVTAVQIAQLPVVWDRTVLA